MQTFIGVLGLEPLHMVSPASEDPRRVTEFPDQLVDCLITMTEAGHPAPRHRDAPLASQRPDRRHSHGRFDQRDAARGRDRPGGRDRPVGEVLSQAEFNDLSRRLPVLVNMRPFGDYSMVDVEADGGVPVVVRELIDAGYLDGEAITCTGETLGEQVQRLAPPPPDHDVIYSVGKPFKDTGGLRLLRGNLAPDGGAILKVAGVEGGVANGVSPVGPACSTASGR